MHNTELKKLVDRFASNIDYYKTNRYAYNEHSCRIEYIDPLLKILGWDVENKAGLAPQFREVIAENYSNKSDRPDYSLTLRGVTKLFVEAKKPSVDISRLADPAIQARKYGWNAKHKIVVLTNFEYFIIYDTTTIPKVIATMFKLQKRTPEANASGAFCLQFSFHFTSIFNHDCCQLSSDSN